MGIDGGVNMGNKKDYPDVREFPNHMILGPTRYDVETQKTYDDKLTVRFTKEKNIGYDPTGFDEIFYFIWKDGEWVVVIDSDARWIRLAHIVEASEKIQEMLEGE